MSLSENFRGAFLMTASMAAFVSNDTLMKLASAEIPLFQALFMRGFLTTIMIVAIAFWQRQLTVKIISSDRKVISLRLLGEVGATLCFLTALFHMQLANVTAILQALPLAVTLGAALFLKDPVGWRRWTAILVGFLGVLIIVRPGSEGFNIYSLLAMAAVAFVVLRDLSTKKLSNRLPSIYVALLTSITITLVGAIMAPFTLWVPVSLEMWLYLTGAAGFLIFAYLFSVMTMRTGEIAFTAPFRYTVMLFAILSGMLVFSEYPDLWTLVGSFIVIATGLYSFYRERKRSI